MCGIFGVVRGIPIADIDPKRVRRSAMLMKHRGPDAYGQWGRAGQVELAHLRLAIIDLNPESNQPFVSSCGQYVVVFNGEIYNYIELRHTLRNLGHKFRTASDTEVLIASYIEWGQACVDRFNGDWAFAVYDLEDDLVFCSRDRFGVKPFNYAVYDNQLIFSSEIKSIIDYCPALRVPNCDVIEAYCRNGLGAQSELTWFENVRRLSPGHNLVWQRGELRINRYWDYPCRTNRSQRIDDSAAEYCQLFVDAVKLRMRSDVPVGSTLSSGIDSGSIVSVLRTFHQEEHKTFTATFDETRFNERERSVYRGDVPMNERVLVEKLANQLNLNAFMVEDSGGQVVAELATVIYHLESGHSSPATLPAYRVLAAASKHVKVVMEGQGADELLGGYTVPMFPTLAFQLLEDGRFVQAYREFDALRRYYSMRHAAKLFVRLLDSRIIETAYHSVKGIDRVFGRKLRRRSGVAPVAATPQQDQRFNRELARSHSTGLVNLLHYGDALSMAHSLESRLPFMDVRLVEFAFGLPYDFKIHNGLGKYVHRVAMAGIVPDFILDNPRKYGFNTPTGSFFSSVNTPANQVLLSERCADRDVFDRGGLRSIIDAHASGSADHATFLFRLLSVELWFRTFIDQERTDSPADQPAYGSAQPHA